MLHPSQEHELALATATRILRAPTGEATGQAPIIYPGTLAERDALAAIDTERWLADERDD